MSFHRRYALRGFFGDSGVELPVAESTTFGESATKKESALSGISVTAYYSKSQTCGARFTPTEAFSIVGFRVYGQQRISYSYGVKLWDAEGNLLATSPALDGIANQWVSVDLDKPVNVEVGKTYVYGGYNSYRGEGTVTFNPKLGNAVGVYRSGDGIPSTSLGTNKMYGVIDMIITDVQVERPDTYQVERTTMDNIAGQVQRITGTTTRMSIDQIVTALEGIAVQSAAE